MPLISIQEADKADLGQPSIQTEFQDSQDYIEKLRLKKNS